MTQRGADPHLRFDEWLLAGAPGEPARDLALHASLCADCTARIAALDLLTAVDPGRAPPPPLLVGAPRPASRLHRVGGYAVAFAGVTLAAALIGVAGWRLIDLRGLAEPVDANAGGSPGQAVLGGTGQSSQAPAPEGSAAASSAPQPDATASPSQAATATSQPAAPPVNQSGATPRPSTPRPSASATPSNSVAPSASASSTPTASPTPTSPASGTPTPSDTPAPTPTETPTPEPTSSP